MRNSLFLLCLILVPGLARSQDASPSSSASQDNNGSQVDPNAPPATSVAPAPRSAGNMLTRLAHQGFVGMLLDHRAELQLAVQQVAALGKLERSFQAQTDSARHQLDSLRKASGQATDGLSLRNPSINAAQLSALLQSQQTMVKLGERILTVQRETRDYALKLLTPAQRTQAIELEKQVRQALTHALHPHGSGSSSQGGSPQP